VAVSKTESLRISFRYNEKESDMHARVDGTRRRLKVRQKVHNKAEKQRRPDTRQKVNEERNRMEHARSGERDEAEREGRRREKAKGRTVNDLLPTLPSLPSSS
jgi:hypothetical protein